MSLKMKHCSGPRGTGRRPPQRCPQMAVTLQGCGTARAAAGRKTQSHSAVRACHGEQVLLPQLRALGEGHQRQPRRQVAATLLSLVRAPASSSTGTAQCTYDVTAKSARTFAAVQVASAAG